MSSKNLLKEVLLSLKNVETVQPSFTEEKEELFFDSVNSGYDALTNTEGNEYLEYLNAEIFDRGLIGGNTPGLNQTNLKQIVDINELGSEFHKQGAIQQTSNPTIDLAQRTVFDQHYNDDYIPSNQVKLVQRANHNYIGDLNLYDEYKEEAKKVMYYNRLNVLQRELMV